MSIHLVLLNWTLNGSLKAPSTRCFSKAIIFISHNMVMKTFHYSLSVSSTQFWEKLMKHHKNGNILAATIQRYPSPQKRRVSTFIICYLVHWNHSLIQLNQVCAYGEVLKKLFFSLVNRILIIRKQVENRIQGLKYP